MLQSWAYPYSTHPPFPSPCKSFSNTFLDFIINNFPPHMCLVTGSTKVPKHKISPEPYEQFLLLHDFLLQKEKFRKQFNILPRNSFQHFDQWKVKTTTKTWINRESSSHLKYAETHTNGPPPIKIFKNIFKIYLKKHVLCSGFSISAPKAFEQKSLRYSAVPNRSWAHPPLISGEIKSMCFSFIDTQLTKIILGKSMGWPGSCLDCF